MQRNSKPRVRRVTSSGSLFSRLIVSLALSFFCAPAFSQDLYTQAVAAFKSGNYPQAAQLFDQLKSSGRVSAEAYYYSAVTYEHLGKYDRASANYLTVVRSFPGTEAARLAMMALQRPSFMQVASQGGASQESRDPGLDFYPKETWVPFKRVRNSLVVDGSINGRSVPMIFDTGASSCTITLNQLKALGLPAPTGEPTGYAGGVGSAKRIPSWTMLVDLQVGKIVRRQFPICVIDSQIGLALLGENFYHDLEYTIDASSSAISFKTRQSTSVLAVASARAGVTVGADGKYVYNVPFTMEGKSLVVTAKVDGQPTQMIFDTGADISMFTARQVQELGVHVQPTGRTVPMGGISGRTMAPIVIVKDVQLGPIDKPLLCAVTDNAAMPRPLLGQEFFKDYPFTIDHANGVIKFEKR
jgi:predicted aspartyl protease